MKHKSTTIISNQITKDDNTFDLQSTVNLVGEFTFQEVLLHMSTNLVAIAQSLQKLANKPVGEPTDVSKE